MEGLACLALSLLFAILGAVPVLAVLVGLMRRELKRLGAGLAVQRQDLQRLREQVRGLEAARAQAVREPAENAVARRIVEDSTLRAEVPAPPVITAPADTPVQPQVTAPPRPEAAPRAERVLPPREAPRPKATAPPPRSFNPERIIVWLASGLGGFLVLLASLFALSVVIDRGWLSPPLRISLGLAAGTGTWLLGTFLRGRRYRWLSSALSGAGMGVLYGTLYAAHSLYSLIPQLPAAVLMSAVTGVAFLDAVRTRDRFMAWLGLLGGLLTPVLVSSGEDNAVKLFAYLTVLVSGALLTAGRRHWPALVLGAGAGAGSLFLLWTSGNHTPDNVSLALVVLAILSAPFAALAHQSRSTLVASAAWIVTVSLPLASLVWLPPVDPTFYDPYSGRWVHRAAGQAPLWVALFVLLLPLVPQLLARARGWAAARLLATLAASLLAAVGVASWVGRDIPPVFALGLMLLAPALSAALAALRDREQGEIWSPAALTSGALLTLCLGAGVADPTLLGVSIAVLVGLGAAHAWTSGAGLVLLALLPATALPLCMAALELDDVGVQAVAGASLLAYAALATLPLLRPWPRQGPTVRVTAALAALAFFFPLYQVWAEGLGDPVIGLLPLLLAAGALVGGVSLVRVHGAHRADGVLALFTAVVLAGLTAALPLQLEGRWLTVTWALEAAALAWLTGRLRHPLIPWSGALLAAAVTVRLVANPYALAYGDASGWPIFNWTLYTWGLPMVAVLIAGRLLRARGTGVVAGLLPPAHTLMGIAIGFALVNVEVSQVFQESGPIELGGHGILQGMVRSLSWAGYGVAVLLAGLWGRSRAVRLVGFAIVLLATGKVFVVDLWALSGFVRVGSVLGLGVTLLLAAFLFERLVLREATPSSEAK